MIGEKLPKDRLEFLLVEEGKKEARVKEMIEELKALKPGECLVYDVNMGMESVWSQSLSHVKNLKLMIRPGEVYAYKEK